MLGMVLFGLGVSLVVWFALQRIIDATMSLEIATELATNHSEIHFKALFRKVRRSFRLVIEGFAAVFWVVAFFAILVAAMLEMAGPALILISLVVPVLMGWEPLIKTYRRVTFVWSHRRTERGL